MMDRLSDLTAKGQGNKALTKINVNLCDVDTGVVCAGFCRRIERAAPNQLAFHNVR